MLCQKFRMPTIVLKDYSTRKGAKRGLQKKSDHVMYLMYLLNFYTFCPNHHCGVYYVKYYWSLIDQFGLGINLGFGLIRLNAICK